MLPLEVCTKNDHSIHHLRWYIIHIAGCSKAIDGGACALTLFLPSASPFSCTAEDIRYFLSSRYGIIVEEDDVRKTILSGLGGGASPEDDDVLDLMEVVAILLIPIFLKAAAANDGHDAGEPTETTTEAIGNVAADPPQPEQAATAANSGLGSDSSKMVPTPPGLLSYVLKMILNDVTGDSKPKPLSEDLIRKILVAYGEYDLAADSKLVEEMYLIAATSTPFGHPQELPSTPNSTATTSSSYSGDNNNPDNYNGNPMLTVESFAQALTQDIRLYDVRNELRVTTNFDDVYVTEERVQANEEEMFDRLTTDEALLQAHHDNQELKQKVAVSEALNRLDTIPSIDITAGTYRSKGLTVLLWATILITYFA